MNHNNRSDWAACDHGPRLEKWATIGGFYHSDIGHIPAQLLICASRSDTATNTPTNMPYQRNEHGLQDKPKSQPTYGKPGIISMPRHGPERPEPTRIPIASSRNPAWPPIPTCQNPQCNWRVLDVVWRIGQGLLGTVLEWSYMHTKDSYAVLILQGYSPPSRNAGTDAHTPHPKYELVHKKIRHARKEPGTKRKEDSRDESHTQLSRKPGGCTVLLQYPSLQLGFGRLV